MPWFFYVGNTNLSKVKKADYKIRHKICFENLLNVKLKLPTINS